MENFWIIDCAQCGQSLRLMAEDKDLGRTVEVICPKCQSRTPTTIGVSVAPEEKGVPVSIKEKAGALMRKMMEDPEISDLIRAIKEDGYESLIVLGPHKHDPHNPHNMVTPKVDSDGKITAGTFTSKDEEELRKMFKIKL